MLISLGTQPQGKKLLLQTALAERTDRYFPNVGKFCLGKVYIIHVSERVMLQIHEGVLTKIYQNHLTSPLVSRDPYIFLDPPMQLGTKLALAIPPVALVNVGFCPSKKRHTSSQPTGKSWSRT